MTDEQHPTPLLPDENLLGFFEVTHLKLGAETISKYGASRSGDMRAYIARKQRSFTLVYTQKKAGKNWSRWERKKTVCFSLQGQVFRIFNHNRGNLREDTYRPSITDFPLDLYQQELNFLFERAGTPHRISDEEAQSAATLQVAALRSTYPLMPAKSKKEAERLFTNPPHRDIRGLYRYATYGDMVAGCTAKHEEQLRGILLTTLPTLTPYESGRVLSMLAASKKLVAEEDRHGLITVARKAHGSPRDTEQASEDYSLDDGLRQFRIASLRRVLKSLAMESRAPYLAALLGPGTSKSVWGDIARLHETTARGQMAQKIDWKRVEGLLHLQEKNFRTIEELLLWLDESFPEMHERITKVENKSVSNVLPVLRSSLTLFDALGSEKAANVVHSLDAYRTNPDLAAAMQSLVDFKTTETSGLSRVDGLYELLADPVMNPFRRALGDAEKLAIRTTHDRTLNQRSSTVSWLGMTSYCQQLLTYAGEQLHQRGYQITDRALGEVLIAMKDCCPQDGRYRVRERKIAAVYWEFLGHGVRYRHIAKALKRDMAPEAIKKFGDLPDAWVDGMLR